MFKQTVRAEPSVCGVTDDCGPALIANLPEDNKHRLVGTGCRFNRDWDAVNSIAQPVKWIQEVELVYRKSIPASVIVSQSHTIKEMKLGLMLVGISIYLESEELESWFLNDVVNDFYCVILQMCAALTWGSAWSDRDTGGRRPSEGPSALSASPGPCPHPDPWATSLLSVQNKTNEEKDIIHFRVLYLLFNDKHITKPKYLTMIS